MEDKTCYAVLWIPTFTHKPFVEHPIQETIRRNISDLVSEELDIIATIRKDKSIGISALGQNGVKKFFLRLDYVDSSRNGLIEYSYKETYCELKSVGFQFTSEVFPEAIYHIIKEFFHEHEFHEKDADTSLPPYTSDKKINLQQNDNPALQHYLERYETALTDLVFFAKRAKEYIAEDLRKKKIKEHFNLWRADIKKIWADVKEQEVFKKRIGIFYHSVKARFAKRYNHYQSFGIIITKAKGYEIYLNALYGSIYNTKCKVCACNNGESTQIDPSKKPTLSILRPIWNTRHIKCLTENTRLDLSHRAHTEPTPAVPNDKPSADSKEKKSEDPQKDMRRRAFNIESLIKYFNACYQQYNQEYIIVKIKNDRLSTKLAIWGIFLTLIFGLFDQPLFKGCSTERKNGEMQVIEHVDTKVDSLNELIRNLVIIQSEQTDKSKKAPPTTHPIDNEINHHISTDNN